MKILMCLVAATALVGCDVNPSKLSTDSIEKFAAKVKCAKGYKNKCWCFVASRKTGNTDSTGIGMTLAPDDLCK